MIQPSDETALPSSRALLRSTAIALAVAILLLVTIVLPSEYGVDPTGVGRLLGLKEMGQIKQRLAREAAGASATETGAAAAAETTPVVAASARISRTDSVSLTLSPNEGREVKLTMRQGDRVAYHWATDRSVVNYDTHADREAPPAIRYHGYGKGQGAPADSGMLVAAFDGRHGWFWRNRSPVTLTVTLRTSGDYQDIQEMK